MALPTPNQGKDAAYTLPMRPPAYATSHGVVVTELPHKWRMHSSADPALSLSQRRLLAPQTQFLYHTTLTDPWVIGMFCWVVKVTNVQQALRQVAMCLSSMQNQARALGLPDRGMYGLTCVEGTVQLWGSYWDDDRYVVSPCLCQ